MTHRESNWLCSVGRKNGVTLMPIRATLANGVRLVTPYTTEGISTGVRFYTRMQKLCVNRVRVTLIHNTPC